MEAYVINGGKRLVGEVEVAGSKNAALALMSAVVLADGVTTLHNVPDLTDTQAKAKLIERFGAKVSWQGTSLTIDSRQLANTEPDGELVSSIRTSFFMMGPLLARVGHVTMPTPGGCKIGARPVDFHIKGLTALGADLRLENGVYHVRADRLRGAEIYLDFPSPGATQHLMSAAVLAEGCTVIQNAAMEPEVMALAGFLRAMGGKVEGDGTSTITIQGVSQLGGCEYRVPSDRIQAGTYLLGAAITRGDVTVRGIIPDHQSPVLSKLRETGCDVMEGHDWVRVSAKGRLKATRVTTMPYPGFPTDMQQPMAAFLSTVEGTSVIDELIYEGRIGHVQELNRMGASITQKGQTSIIDGVKALGGAVVKASDLRAGAALVLAGLAAEGETEVRNIHFIDRGYERLDTIIRQLGGDMVRGRFADRRL